MRKIIKSICLLSATITLSLSSATSTLASPRWVTGRQGYFPSNAVRGGTDNGNTLYVCSVGFATGKLAPSHRTCYIGWGGKEHAYQKYQVLVGNNSVRWVRLTGALPRNAIVGARENGETGYVCSAKYNGEWTPGKYFPSHDTCYIGWGGKEISIRDFYILVNK